MAPAAALMRAGHTCHDDVGQCSLFQKARAGPLQSSRCMPLQCTADNRQATRLAPPSKNGATSACHAHPATARQRQIRTARRAADDTCVQDAKREATLSLLWLAAALEHHKVVVELHPCGWHRPVPVLKCTPERFDVRLGQDLE